MYPQFWLEQGHKDKLTCYLTILKATFGNSRNISSVSLVYETSPTILNVAALHQQLQKFMMAMVNNYEHIIHLIDLYVHLITKHWYYLAQSSPLKGMLLEFFKLA